MVGLSNYTANKVNDYVFGNVSYTPPVTLYAALAKGTVLESDTGSTFDEADFGGYARVAITNNATEFPAASGGAKTLGNDLTFPVSTSGSNTILELIFLDAATAGNIVGGGVLTVSKLVETGTQLVFNADEVEITVD